jgi:hypothetical protein
VNPLEFDQDRRPQSPEINEEFDVDQGVVALAATLAVALGALVLVVGLAVSGLLTALLCAVLAVCVVGLAVAMLSP